MEMPRRLAIARSVATRVGVELASPWRALIAEFGTSAVETARAHGLITDVLHGIYVRAGTEAAFRVRVQALTHWVAPLGVVTGLAAANLWSIVDVEPRRITVQVPREWSLRVPGWARALRIGVVDKRYRLGGILLAPAPDAVVQVWREARADIGASTVIAAIVRGKSTAQDLVDAAARRKRLPRRGELTELIGLVGNTITSYLEYVAWKKVFPPRLFPDLQWQVETWSRGRRRVMDAFDPEAMIDLEFDGGGTHGGVDGFERDRERDADMRAAGIEPLHFTYRDLTERPEWCRQQYLALRAARLASRRP